MSITKIGPQRWSLDVHPTHGGRRRRLTVMGTKEVAKRTHDRLEQECTGRLPDGREAAKLHVKDVTQMVVDDYRRKERKTINDAIQMAARWNAEYGSVLLPSMKAPILLNVCDTWKDPQHKTGGLSPARINRLMGFFLRGIRLLKRDERYKDFPIPHWEHLPEAPPRSGFLEWHEFRPLRDVMPPYGRVPVTIGFWAGMREEEILGLKWSQVKLNHTRKRVIIDLRSDQTKTDEARIVVLPGDLYTEIKAWEAYTRQHYPTCLWVCHRNGRRLTSTRSFWQRACVKVGLGAWKNPEVGTSGQQQYTGKVFHDLRRTGVRNLIRSGVPIKTAMKISGHKTLAVFERYNIVNPQDLETASDKLEAYMKTAQEEDITGRSEHGTNPEPARAPSS